MNNTESKEPLYRQLNKERTQGEWKFEGYNNDSKNSVLYSDFNTHGFANFYPENNTQANAQYTALAVNNLSILAEALEETLKYMTLDSKGAINAHKKIISALQRIS